MKTDLTEKDLELLSAFLDGELGAEDAQAVRARLLSEAPLRAAFDQLKSADNRLREDLHVPGVDAVPPRIRQMVENAGSGPSFGSKRATWGFGLAASVLIAAGVVFNVGQQTGGGSQLSTDPQIAAGQLTTGARFAAEDVLVSPMLERALSRGTGWEDLADGSRVRPLLSFPDVDGGWCREYLLAREGRQWRGVACRASDQESQDNSYWLTAVLVPEKTTGSVNDGYRPAGAGSPEQVDAFIDSRAADIPLSREQEAELIARGWK